MIGGHLGFSVSDFKRTKVPGGEGLLSPKSNMDVPAVPRKSGFLFTNFLLNFPPITIPFSKEKHQILTNFTFYNNLSEIHQIYLIWAPSSLMKNWVFLCSLDNLLQKNVIVFFFENQLSKWRSFEKRAIFDLFSTFFSHQGKVAKIPTAHISLTYIHVFCSPYWLFLPYQFWKKKKIPIYQVRFLSDMSPGVDSYSRHFGTINK